MAFGGVCAASLFQGSPHAVFSRARHPVPDVLSLLPPWNTRAMDGHQVSTTGRTGLDDMLPSAYTTAAPGRESCCGFGAVGTDDGDLEKALSGEIVVHNSIIARPIYTNTDLV